MDDKFFIVYSTVIELLEDRGYNVPKKNKFKTLGELQKKFKTRNDIDLYLSKKGNPEDDIIVYFFAEMGSINAAFLESRLLKINTDNISKSIFVARVKKSFTSAGIKELGPLGDDVTFFIEKELSFNISHHILVPKHELLSEEAAEKVKVEFSLNEDSQIPKILTSDPVSKYYGFVPGDFIRIHRKSQTAGKYNHYRLVVSDV